MSRAGVYELCTSARFRGLILITRVHRTASNRTGRDCLKHALFGGRERPGICVSAPRTSRFLTCKTDRNWPVHWLDKGACDSAEATSIVTRQLEVAIRARKSR